MDKEQTEKTDFHQDYLEKKDSKGKWRSYWVIMDGKYLLFYESIANEQIFGSIEIGSDTKCIVAQRKVNSFPFMVCAVHGKHLFKSPSSIHRHKWMAAIDNAVQLLRVSPSCVIVEPADESRPDDVTGGTELGAGDEVDGALPANVVLVTSFPAMSDSPTLPFRIRDRRKHSAEISEKAKPTVQKSSTVLYPFIRTSQALPSQANTSSENHELNTLNLPRGLSLCDHDTREWYTRDQSVSPHNRRSFPSTPEKDRPRSSTLPSPLNFTAHHHRAKSLNNIQPSNYNMLTCNTRFSRHMVAGNTDIDL